MTGPLLNRERVQFQDFSFQRLDDGRCTACVDLALPDDEHFVGEAEGLASPTGELRCAATAALEALRHVTEPQGIEFKLLGVKAVKAFDSSVVIVALSAAKSEQETVRLVGAYLTSDDLTRGAAVAVLNATNRYLGNYFVTS